MLLLVFCLVAQEPALSYKQIPGHAIDMLVRKTFFISDYFEGFSKNK